MKNNWNIGSLLSIYKDIDFRNHEYINNITLTGDLMYPKYLINKIWTLEELVFIKGNRFNINSILNEKKLSKKLKRKIPKNINIKSDIAHILQTRKIYSFFNPCSITKIF